MRNGFAGYFQEGDDASDHVDLNEWLKGMRRLKKEQGSQLFEFFLEYVERCLGTFDNSVAANTRLPRGTTALFNLLDADRTGTLSMDELAKAHAGNSNVFCDMQQNEAKEVTQENWNMWVLLYLLKHGPRRIQTLIDQMTKNAEKARAGAKKKKPLSSSEAALTKEEIAVTDLIFFNLDKDQSGTLSLKARGD